jgi:hypothetical protein
MEVRLRVRIVLLILIASMLKATLACGASIPNEIPFKLVKGYAIVVRGKIGSMSNLNFVLDTGAVPSVVSKRVASRMGITGTSGPLALLDKNLTVKYVTVNDVRFGWVQAVALPMVVADLEGLGYTLGTRVDAIVGLDVLNRQAFSIDYKHRRLTPSRSEHAQHIVPVEIYGNGGAPYWVLPVTLGGQAFRLLLDTGASELALFAGLTVTETVSNPIKSVKLRGKIEVRVLQPTLLILGDASFQRQLAVELENPRGAALPEIDGVLGPTALGITRIEFDWEHKCLRWDAE